jgi:6-phosphofructokinase 1
MADSSRGKLGIVVGGGPAPGINGVISSVTIEAINQGLEVIGIRDGFKHLASGDITQIRPLSIQEVAPFYQKGGSMLGTSRTNPAKDPKHMANVIDGLNRLGIKYLVTIGGDDTAFSGSQVYANANKAIKVAHVPKTIDNDLPLPSGKSTFGFQTARHVGAEIVENLMTDAMTTKRWFFIVAMGRSAGHLALGIAKAAGATLAVIAEEWAPGEPIRLEHVVDVLETSMLKRMVHGRPFGVALLAEGIGLRLPPEDVARAEPNCERDQHGNLRLSELHLHRLLTRLVRARAGRRSRSSPSRSATSCAAPTRSRATSSTRATPAAARSSTSTASAAASARSPAAWSPSTRAASAPCPSAASATPRPAASRSARSTSPPRPTTSPAST